MISLGRRVLSVTGKSVASVVFTQARLNTILPLSPSCRLFHAPPHCIVRATGGWNLADVFIYVDGEGRGRAGGVGVNGAAVWGGWRWWLEVIGVIF